MSMKRMLLLLCNGTSTPGAAARCCDLPLGVTLASWQSSTSSSAAALCWGVGTRHQAAAAGELGPAHLAWYVPEEQGLHLPGQQNSSICKPRAHSISYSVGTEES